MRFFIGGKDKGQVDWKDLVCHVYSLNRWIYLLVILSISNCDSPESDEAVRSVVAAKQISWGAGWAKDLLERHRAPLPEPIKPESLILHPLGVEDGSCSSPCDASTMAWLREMALVSQDGTYMDRAERLLYNRYATSADSLPDPRSVAVFEQADTLWINLFLPMMVTDVGPGDAWQVSLSTDYPKKGDIRIVMEGRPTGAWTLAFRQPGWTDNRPDPEARYRWRTNRKLVADLVGEYLYPELRKGYAYLTRAWQNGDELHLQFPMSVRRLIVGHDSPKMSIELGPVVLAATNNPEGLEALPDQGPFTMFVGENGIERWSLPVNGDSLMFARWPMIENREAAMVQWSIAP